MDNGKAFTIAKGFEIPAAAECIRYVSRCFKIWQNTSFFTKEKKKENNFGFFALAVISMGAGQTRIPARRSK
jgi:hypothetical protein